MNAALEESTKWSDAYLVTPDKFQNEISNYINPDLSKNYISALITRECWQATPGKVIDIIRHIGICKGGKILEDCELVEVHRDNNIYEAVVKTHNNKFIEYEAFHFINALGSEGEKFARQMGFETGLYPVKHQAFITRRLPMLGINGLPLDMLIDRRNYKGFSAVYGQQLGDTGQVIGCASPFNEYHEAAKNIKTNSKEFLEIISEVFVTWLPILSSVGFQAVWAGYYTEPRMIIDPDAGLFLGLRGQGFMLGQYLAKLYVDKVSGKNTPEYLTRLSLNGDGLPENAFK
jgi:glycine/D-amino acid oxidase-like deaminating enzyme